MQCTLTREDLRVLFHNYERLKRAEIRTALQRFSELRDNARVALGPQLIQLGEQISQGSIAYNIEHVPQDLLNAKMYSAFLIRGRIDDFYDRAVERVRQMSYDRRKINPLGNIMHSSDIFTCADAALFDLMHQVHDWPLDDCFIYVSVSGVILNLPVVNVITFQEVAYALYDIEDREEYINLTSTQTLLAELDDEDPTNDNNIYLSDVVHYPRNFDDVPTLNDYFIIRNKKPLPESFGDIERRIERSGLSREEKSIALARAINFNSYTSLRSFLVGRQHLKKSAVDLISRIADDGPEFVGEDRYILDEDE